MFFVFQNSNETILEVLNVKRAMCYENKTKYISAFHFNYKTKGIFAKNFETFW